MAEADHEHPVMPPSESKPRPTRSARPRWLRAILLAAGVVSLGLGVLGIFLPLLPTTPLVLLAAFFFAQGSSRAHNWLLRHRVFGPIVHEWQEHRSIPRRAKQSSIVLVIVAFSISAFVIPPDPLLYGVLVVTGLVLIVFLARLPSSSGASVRAADDNRPEPTEPTRTYGQDAEAHPSGSSAAENGPHAGNGAGGAGPPRKLKSSR